MAFKAQKTEELIKHLAAEFLQRESNHISLITVTAVTLHNKFTKATIFVTVYPDHKQPEALDFINRKRTEFREYLKERSRLMKLPQVEFALDLGEMNRQRIEELSNQ
jgi:ribosome-binding factor A